MESISAIFQEGVASRLAPASLGETLPPWMAGGGKKIPTFLDALFHLTEKNTSLQKKMWTPTKQAPCNLVENLNVMVILGLNLPSRDVQHLRINLMCPSIGFRGKQIQVFLVS